MILGTNALSAVAEGDAALERLLRTAQRLSIPVIVLGEYRRGILHSRDRHDYEQWLSEHLQAFQTLEVDERTTLPYSAIRTE